MVCQGVHEGNQGNESKGEEGNGGLTEDKEDTGGDRESNRQS